MPTKRVRDSAGQDADWQEAAKLAAELSEDVEATPARAEPVEVLRPEPVRASKATPPATPKETLRPELKMTQADLETAVAEFTLDSPTLERVRDAADALAARERETARLRGMLRAAVVAASRAGATTRAIAEASGYTISHTTAATWAKEAE